MFAYGPKVKVSSKFGLSYRLLIISEVCYAFVNVSPTQALVDPSMSWKRQPDRKISDFTPGKGISFMLASDVALYKEIKVTLSDQLITNCSLNRWLPMAEGLAKAPP